MAQIQQMIPRQPRQPKPPRTTEQLMQRQSNLEGRREQLINSGRKETPKLDRRLNAIQGRLDKGQSASFHQPQTGGGLTYQPGTGDPGAAWGGQQDAGAAPLQPEQTGTFKTVQDFIPSDITNSPLYQYQQTEGLRALDRLMAARGRTGSGAEVEANAKFLNQLGAQEADRQQNLASQNYSAYNSQRESEASRRDAQQQNAFNNYYSMLQLGLSQSPMDQAYGAAGQGANMTNQYGQRRGGQQSQQYRHVSAGGGGGGGGSAPIYAPPFASQPNFSGSDILGAIGAGSQQNPFLQTLPYFFK